jgi:hypothetical protein
MICRYTGIVWSQGRQPGHLIPRVNSDRELRFESFSDLHFELRQVTEHGARRLAQFTDKLGGNLGVRVRRCPDNGASNKPAL